MFNTKRLTFIAITLLILQILLPNLSFINISEASENQNNKVKVNVKSADRSQITWEIVIDPLGEELEEAKTSIVFGDGLEHHDITHDDELQVTKTDHGYILATAKSSKTYTVEVVTKIASDELETFTLQAKLEVNESTYQATNSITLEDKAAVETSEESNEEEAKSKENEKQLEELKKEKSKENEKQLEELKEEKSSYDSVLETLKSKPLEQFSEDELRVLFKNLTEEEIAKLQNEFEETEVVGEYDPNFKPFLTSPKSMLTMMSSNPVWPNPGSVNVNGKTATSTSNYGEWEIELSVEAKDIDTTKRSDIVLVLDKSGSMQGSRLQKAKAAAIQFINELLTEDSQTRIAVVTFNNDYQTLGDGFRTFNQKQSLINQINGVSASGGTNIQAGLREANNLFSNSTAENKIIVLLSDGEPTYSYKANSHIANYNWEAGNYDVKLSDFSSYRVGNGSSYNLPRNQRYYVDRECFIICWGGYEVTTNGLPTISEAKDIMNNGIDMYSIGLEVGNNTNATNVLINSQNKGYFQAGVDDLSEIFGEIAGEIKAAATNAVVTDPIGEMFKLVRGAYSGNDFSLNQGTASYDEATKTITWNIGTINEGDHPTLKYTVTIDWDHPNLKGHVYYPMNEETPLNYTDFNGNPATKYFDIPEGEIGKGKIKRIGYRVNPTGQPIDSAGNVVTREQAQIFYDEYYESFHEFGTHSVPAKEVADYTLIVGHNPTSVDIGPNNPVEIVYFGYVKTSDLPAGNITVKHVDENGVDLVAPETLSGNIGASYNTASKDIPGYAFVTMGEGSAPASGVFTHEEQTVIYVYKQLNGKIEVIKVDAEDQNKKLKGAKFELRDMEDNVINTGTTNDFGKLIFIDLPVGTYKLVEVEAPEGYRLITKPIEIDITVNKLHVTKIIENSTQGWVIPQTGGIGTLGLLSTGLLIAGTSGWYLIRRRHEN